TPIMIELMGIHNGSVHYDPERIDSIVEICFKDHPQDLMVQIEYNNLLYRREQFGEVKENINAFLKKHPLNVRALTLLSRIYMREKNYKEACNTLNRANLLSPKNSKRLCLLGESYFRQGDVKSARKF